MLPFLPPTAFIQEIVIEIRQVDLTFVVGKQVAVFGIELQTALTKPRWRDRSIRVGGDIPVDWDGKAGTP